jgi:hypothetical protein
MRGAYFKRNVSGGSKAKDSETGAVTFGSSFSHECSSGLFFSEHVVAPHFANKYII